MGSGVKRKLFPFNSKILPMIITKKRLETMKVNIKKYKDFNPYKQQWQQTNGTNSTKKESKKSDKETLKE